MNQKEQFTTIKFNKEQEYQDIVKLRNTFRVQFKMPKLSLRETIMKLVNKELENNESSNSN